MIATAQKEMSIFVCQGSHLYVFTVHRISTHWQKLFGLNVSQSRHYIFFGHGHLRSLRAEWKESSLLLYHADFIPSHVVLKPYFFCI